MQAEILIIHKNFGFLSSKTQKQFGVDEKTLNCNRNNQFSKVLIPLTETYGKEIKLKEFIH